VPDPERNYRLSLGREPLPRDDRDLMLRNTARWEKLVTLATTRWWGMVGPTMRIDQLQEGTCVGHGCTNVLMASPSEHKLFPSFADRFTAHVFARQLYFDATGDATYQEGAYTRSALDVLHKRGQLAAYYRLGSVDEILNTLRGVGPVTFGSTWYEPMFDTHAQYGNEYLRVDIGSGIAGGHLYCLTGVNLAPAQGPPYVRMENSWGPTWGHNGTARITIDDLHVLYDSDAFLLTETVF